MKCAWAFVLAVLLSAPAVAQFSAPSSSGSVTLNPARADVAASYTATGDSGVRTAPQASPASLGACAALAGARAAATPSGDTAPSPYFCDGVAWRRTYTDVDGVLPNPDDAVPGQRFVAQAISGQTAFAAEDGTFWRIGRCPNCYLRVLGASIYMPFLNGEQASVDALTSYRFQAALNLVNAPHGITFNGTTAIKGVVRVSVTHDFSEVAAQTCAEESVTATGAATSDFAKAMADFALPAGVFVGGVRVTAANTVGLMLCNTTAAPLNPASGTYRIRMER